MGSTRVYNENRDLYQEGTDTLNAQIDLAPDVFAAESTYRPQYANLDRQILYESLYGNGSDTPGYLDIMTGVQDWANARNATANTYSRTSDILDVQNLGPAVIQEIKNANPELYANLDRFDQLALNDGTSDLLGRLDTLGAGLPGASRIGMLGVGEAEQLMLDRANTPLERMSYISGSNKVGNIEASALLNSLNEQATAVGVNGGKSELLSTLEQQAMNELNSGSGLTALERRDIEQSVLSTANAQGRARGNRAMSGVALALDRGMRDRLAERRDFAGVTSDRVQTAENSARNFQLGVEGANQNLQGMNTSINLANQADELQRAVTNVGIDRTNKVDIPVAEFGFAQAANAARLSREGINTQRTSVNQQADQIDFSNQMSLLQMRTGLLDRQIRNAGAAAEMRRSVMIDPFAGVLGRSSVNTTNSGQAMNYGYTGTQSGAQMFDPFTAYAADLYNTNVNGENASNISAANANAQQNAGFMSALAAIASYAMIAACWVARRSLGKKRRDWRWFRAWLFTEAPADFREWYLRRGEAYAGAMTDLQASYWRPWMQQMAARAKELMNWADVQALEQRENLLLDW